jgi:hypothetical protein
MRSSSSGEIGGIAAGRRFQFGFQDGCIGKRRG